ERINGYASDFLEKRSHAAMAIGVIQSNRTEMFFFGQLSATNAQPPNADTLFELGTVSQVLTALTAQKMVADGKLKWTSTVRDILPAEVKLAPVFSQITLGHLATHRSGLPSVPGNMSAESIDRSNPFKDYSQDDLYSYFADLKSSGAPGGGVEISRLGYALLGHLLEQSAGKPFETVVTQEVLMPLNMTNSVMTVGSRTNVAVGHNSEGQPATAWDSGQFAGAVGFRSTLGDLLKLVEANLQPDETSLGEVLTECQEVQATAFGGRTFGYGWVLTSTLQGELDFVWLSGGTGGFVSFIGFDRTHGNGIVMLANSGIAMSGDFYLDTLAMEILKLSAKISLD
ncbi:MAG: serine hydrolase domain-containing protein, partial [Limisphaerales bacterium]